MKRWLIWLLGTMLTVAVLLGGTVAVLSTTQWGARWLAARITGALAGELSIAAVHGRLIGPLRIEGLHYHRGARTVTIAAVDLNWRPSALLAGTVHISRLELDGLRYAQTAPPPPPAGQGGGLPDVRLPLKVKIDRLAVRRVSVERYGHAPVRVDTISLAARADRRSVHVAHLSVSAPRFDVVLHGSVQPHGAYAMNWHADWTVRPPNLPPFSGLLEIKGSLKSLDLAQTLNTPVRVDVHGHVDDATKNAAWRARVSLRQVRARDIRAGLPPVEVSGDVHLEGDLHSASAQGDLSVETRLKSRRLPIDSRFALSYKEAALTISKLNLRIPGTPTQIDVHGRLLHPTGARDVSLQGNWTHLAWPPAGQGTTAFVSETGRVDISGTLDAYTLGLRASLAGRRLPPGDLRLRAKGDRRALTVTDLQLHVLDGRLAARGTVAWRPRLSWRLTLHGEHLNPARIRPAYPGDIGLAAVTTGERGAAGLTVDVDLKRLDGKLRGYPLDAAAHIGLAQSRLTVHRLSLATGRTSASASGTLGKTWNLRWKIDSPDLQAVYPEAHGALAGHGRLGGRLKRPEVRASLTGHRLRYRDYRLKQLRASLDVDSSQGRRSTADIEIFGLQLPRGTVDFARLTGSGVVSDHHLDAAVHTRAGVLSVSVAGGYEAGKWSGSLRKLELIGPQVGYWHLADTVPVSLARDDVQLGRLCWQRRDARMCARGAWHRGGDWLADLQLQGLHLQWLQPFFSAQTKLSGSVNADLTARRKGSVLSGNGQVRLQGAAIDTTLPNGAPLAVTVTRAELQAKTRDRTIHTTVTLAIAQGGSLDGELTVPLAALPGMGPPAGPTPGIKGQLNAKLTDLKMLARVVPALDKPQGTLTGTLRIAGTLHRPELAGRLDLKNGAVDIPRVGIRVTDMSVTAKSADGKTFAVTADARSGGGSAHIEADGPLPLADDQTMTVKITSTRFEVAKIPEAQALATSDITLKVSPKEVQFSGTVTIPQARLHPRDVSSAVNPSTDVVVVNGPVEQKAAGRSIRGVIHVNLGRNVRFKGFGLTGQVAGSIAVQEQPKQPTLGFGNLDITGKYKAYGQKLDIQQGRLSYVGSPIDNPGLNIRAVRTTGDVTAGIHVTGTLQSPHLAIFSQPPMDDANALSYLLLGRPINQASTQQGNTLSNAATALGLSGGEFLAKKIGAMFGITDVKVESGSGSQTASLVLGKYLTPDLYISYGFGLLQPLNTLQLRYRMSTHWELKAQSGLYNGGDILYTIDTR